MHQHVGTTTVLLLLLVLRRRRTSNLLLVPTLLSRQQTLPMSVAQLSTLVAVLAVTTHVSWFPAPVTDARPPLLEALPLALTLLRSSLKLFLLLEATIALWFITTPLPTGPVHEPLAFVDASLDHQCTIHGIPILGQHQYCQLALNSRP